LARGKPSGGLHRLDAESKMKLTRPTHGSS
jgi:hypothetical protein